jgi:endonuclease/exonuclease/phosphatase family metal-dependent hydrolase
MRNHRIGNDKDGYQDIPFTAEEEAAKDDEVQAWADARPAREMERIREHRNGLLSATDWTANSDITMSDAMKTYRQMLRDIPASNTVYDDVDWGTKP